MAQVQKLVQLYQESQTEAEQQELSYQVEQASIQLQSDILATKQSLAKAEREVKATIKKVPFSSKAIIDAKNNVKALEAGLKELEKLQKELF